MTSVEGLRGRSLADLERAPAVLAEQLRQLADEARALSVDHCTALLDSHEAGAAIAARLRGMRDDAREARASVESTHAELVHLRADVDAKLLRHRRAVRTLQHHAEVRSPAPLPSRIPARPRASGAKGVGD